MTDKVAELTTILQADNEARWVANLWNTWNNQRAGIVAEWQELEAYLYATDTSTTSNKSLPWKNSTTRPKLTQIMDNLYSNYISALFPNDRWLKWEAYTEESDDKTKAENITGYVDNKARQSRLRSTVGLCVYDYIKKGNAFITVDFERRYNRNIDDTFLSYMGPKSIRIDPLNIVFNPTATSIEHTPIIIRSTKTIGELLKASQTNPSMAFWEDAVTRRLDMRKHLGSYNKDDWEKAEQFSIDGFGNLYEYYGSNYVDILEFYGDYYDSSTGELFENRMITIVDRSIMVRNEPISTYSGRAPIRHVGWRERSGNLWAMSPLANLVGMQYRIDHLENLKADAWDLTVLPPLKVIGEVEEFVWGPNVQIQIDEQGDVIELGKNLQPLLAVENEIMQLEDQMELFAGAPREAMGIRSPGEKTAFEVQTLNNAAGRIFQEKVTKFEIELLEPHLNDFLEIGHRNLEGIDVISIKDPDLKVDEFREITRDDIQAKGIIRPVGARHFAQKAQDLQNIVGVFNSNLYEVVKPHTSGIEMAEFLNDVLNFRGYTIFKPNVFIDEQQETQAQMNQAEEDLQVEAEAPVTDPNMGEEEPATDEDVMA